eukprot:TRINITY_DN30194_c0_g1_i1.p1 TRINITY_DN30194_c0_g1~~TRINITY_DN30194_c0_g1_i1.p1  ORF type:complete len:424 (+),score=116.24 TRINITY_DN30194_c0_g1_i1:78-1274(+)
MSVEDQKEEPKEEPKEAPKEEAEKDERLSKKGPELFRELLRIYSVADVQDYYKNGVWADATMRTDLQLIEAHRRESGAPEPPPLEEVEMPDMPHLKAALTLAGQGLAGLAALAGISKGTSGGPTPPTAIELRLIGLFIAKWKVDADKTKEWLEKIAPNRRRYVVSNFKAPEGCDDVTKALEDYMAECEKSGVWGEAVNAAAAVSPSPAVRSLSSSILSTATPAGGVKRSLSAMLQGGSGGGSASSDISKRLRAGAPAAAGASLGYAGGFGAQNTPSPAAAALAARFGTSATAPSVRPLTSPLAAARTASSALADRFRASIPANRPLTSAAAPLQAPRGSLTASLFRQGTAPPAAASWRPPAASAGYNSSYNSSWGGAARPPAPASGGGGLFKSILQPW